MKMNSITKWKYFKNVKKYIPIYMCKKQTKQYNIKKDKYIE